MHPAALALDHGRITGNAYRISDSRIVQYTRPAYGNVGMCTRTHGLTMRKTRIYRIARYDTHAYAHTHTHAHITRICTHVRDHGRANTCSIDLEIATEILRHPT